MPRPQSSLAQLLAALLLGLLSGTILSPTALADPSRHPTGAVGTEASTTTLYLDNGQVRVGADLAVGGAITWLSDSQERRNIVNNYDWGRQVQVSFYSSPIPFIPPSGRKPHKDWAFVGWNPIQVGDCYYNPSPILKHRHSKNEIYVKCVPLHWPLNNVSGECTYECWIRLEGRAARVRVRFTNHRADKTQYPAVARPQELPAVFVNANYNRLMVYGGDRPFTSDALTRLSTENLNVSPQNPPGHDVYNRYNPESWMAFLRQDGWGLALWHPGCHHITGCFFGKERQGGTKDVTCGYMSANRREVLDHNIVYEYEYYLVVGTMEQIRDYIYERAERPAPPSYRFKKDRQHWFYVNASDAGWPIRGELRVNLDQQDPQLWSPAGHWRAEEAPKLRIEAAFKVARPTPAQVFFLTHYPQLPDMGNEKAPWRGPASFEFINDGKFHTYEIDLSALAGYKGAIAGLRFDPVVAGQPGDLVRVRSITLHK